MASPKNNKREHLVDELLAKLETGELTAEERAEFEDAIAKEPSTRRRYAEYTFLSFMLSDPATYSKEDLAGSQENPPGPVCVSPRFNFMTKGHALAAGMGAMLAVVMLLPLVLWASSGQANTDVSPPIGLLTNFPNPEQLGFEQPVPGGEPDDSVAVLVKAIDVQWAENQHLEVNSVIRPGLLKFTKGVIEIEFYSGTSLIAQGPCELEILDTMSVYCGLGELRAEIPEIAYGFKLFTPGIEIAELVDVGTDFGVSVDSQRNTSLHVFEGRIELRPNGLGQGQELPTKLAAGKSTVIDTRGQTRAELPVSTDFVSRSRVAALHLKETEADLRQWQQHRDRLQKDPRVVAYYDFEPRTPESRILYSHQTSSRSLDGVIVGCQWDEGRWPGKSSLRFKGTGDRVRVNIPGEFDSVTYSAWIQLDGLNHVYNSLLLTDDWEVGRLHWQITQPGRLQFGMRLSKSPSNREAFYTPTIFEKNALGRWRHVVSVYDHRREVTSHYIDGQKVSMTPIFELSKMQIGSASIGNWSNIHHRPSSPSRTFSGRMDELVIFNVALQEEEIARLYSLDVIETSGSWN